MQMDRPDSPKVGPALQRYLVGEAVDHRVDETGGPAEDIGDKMENAVLRRRHWVHHWKQQMITGMKA